jgi:hypothetical protein
VFIKKLGQRSSETIDGRKRTIRTRDPMGLVSQRSAAPRPYF